MIKKDRIIAFFGPHVYYGCSKKSYCCLNHCSDDSCLKLERDALPN